MNDNIKAGSDIHAGDGGYSEGTQEAYEEFAKVRNQSLAEARLKALEEQSWVYQMRVYDNDGVRTYGEREQVFSKKKFAELIVKECALIAGLMEMGGRKNIGANILDAFGIQK
jgi:anti-sigma factor RsiW